MIKVLGSPTIAHSSLPYVVLISTNCCSIPFFTILSYQIPELATFYYFLSSGCYGHLFPTTWPWYASKPLVTCIHLSHNSSCPILLCEYVHPVVFLDSLFYINEKLVSENIAPGNATYNLGARSNDCDVYSSNSSKSVLLFHISLILMLPSLQLSKIMACF